MPPRNLPRWLPILLLLVLVPAVGCGKKSTGPKTIAQQLAEARAIESPEAKARALVRIARRQLKSSDKAGAGKTLAEARGLIKPDADPAVAGQRLVEIADLYAKSDARPVARESLKQGIEMAGRVTDPIAKIRILADAATVSGAKTGGLGDAKAAREALDSATAAAEGVEERFKVQAFAAIAVALAKVGLNTDAAKLADTLEEMARGQDDPRAKAEALAAAANVRAARRPAGLHHCRPQSVCCSLCPAIARTSRRPLQLHLQSQPVRLALGDTWDPTLLVCSCHTRY